MTATPISLSLLLALAGTPSLPADPPGPPPGPWVECPTPHKDAACSHLYRAVELVEENRTRKAIREVGRAIQIRRSAGEYPGGELWFLANLQYHSGRMRQAARTLDLLATEAHRVGDLDRLALALTESIILHAANGRREWAVARLDRLMPLLDSPYLPASRVEYIRERLIGV